MSPIDRDYVRKLLSDVEEAISVILRIVQSLSKLLAELRGARLGTTSWF